MDKNLERIKLPKFNGDKTKFENFWATFESIVDETDEPAKYKMIRIKSCLEGKAEGWSSPEKPAKKQKTH